MQKHDFMMASLEHMGYWDTVVVGGGTAGTAAAIAAARAGNHTLIVEKTINVGGTAVNGLVTPMMPSYVDHGQVFCDLETRLRSYGLETRDDKMGYVWSTAETKAQAIEELLLEAGVELLYEAQLVGCQVQEQQIHTIFVMTVKGILAISAEQFVDATADAVLSRMAGVPCDSGDENGNNQMTSLRFEMAGIDVDEYRNYCLSLQDKFSPLTSGFFWESAMVGGRDFKIEPLFMKGVEAGLLQLEDLTYYQCFSLPGAPGAMSFNCPHLTFIKNNTDPVQRSKAVVQGRQMVMRLVKFLQTFMPGFQHAFITRTASELGVRESYRIQGKYCLTETDYVQRARFTDVVARGDWYIDVHSATKGIVHMEKYRKGEYYEIPYRCLVNNYVFNLITVGRCISTTFLAQASIRIQPTVIDMGESAGIACALAKKSGTALTYFTGENLFTPVGGASWY